MCSVIRLSLRLLTRLGVNTFRTQIVNGRLLNLGSLRKKRLMNLALSRRNRPAAMVLNSWRLRRTTRVISRCRTRWKSRSRLKREKLGERLVLMVTLFLPRLRCTIARSRRSALTRSVVTRLYLARLISRLLRNLKCPRSGISTLTTSVMTRLNYAMTRRSLLRTLTL